MDPGSPLQALTVEQFMQHALYDPAAGYYTHRIASVGARGDFSTGPTIASWLGKAVARWAETTRASLAPRRPACLIEVGAGTGAMGASVLHALGWWNRRHWTYRIVDISKPLLTAQQETLRTFGSRVQWHATMTEALEAANGDALIFSNELVDAFPCRRFILGEDGNWRETLVARADESWRETAGGQIPDPNTLASTVFQAWPKPPKPGQTVEVHAAYRAWLQTWAPLWKSGAMLTLDYGDCFPAIYARSPTGTLRAYFRQMRFTGDEVFQRAGHQDITADVNFSDLMLWGGAQGWANAPLQNQREFLIRWRPEIIRSKEPAAKFLIDSDGMGGAFKALEQRLK